MDKKRHRASFWALKAEQKTDRKTRRQKVSFGVDFGAILAPILATFWIKNGGKNEPEKQMKQK